MLYVSSRRLVFLYSIMNIIRVAFVLPSAEVGKFCVKLELMFVDDEAAHKHISLNGIDVVVDEDDDDVCGKHETKQQQ